MGSSPVTLLDQNYEYINWKITKSGFEDQCLLGLISFTMSQSFKVSRLISGTMTEFIIREQHDSVTRRLHLQQDVRLRPNGGILQRCGDRHPGCQPEGGS